MVFPGLATWVIIRFFFRLAALGFEFRALHLLGRLSTTSSKLPAVIFYSGSFGDRVLLYAWASLDYDPLLVLPHT
jgi:hypothetical protein